MAAAVMDAALLQTNSLEIAFVNMFTGNHAITTNGIATMNLSIATKNAADKCHSTIKNSAAAMFHSIIAKLAADMCLITTTHVTAHIVQNTLVNVAANTFQDTTTNAHAAIQIPAAQQDLINSHRAICQTGGGLPTCLFLCSNSFCNLPCG